MINKTVFDNGIRLVTEEIDHVRSVSIGAWIRCGARYENGKTNGMSHFIEHMLFKGTKSRTAFDIAASIDSVGGVMNAFTGKEYTSFYIKIPDYHLALAIDLLADILGDSIFEASEFEREKSVILQEIRMLEDSPDEYIHDLFEASFWNDHSLGYPILGLKDQVESFERHNVLEFFEQWYTGENLVITAAGNLSHAVLIDLIDRKFGSFGKRKTSREDIVPQEAPVVSSKIRAFEKDLEQIHMVIGTLAPSAVSPKRHPGFLMNAVLGGSMSSRLFQEIREKRGLAYAIHSYMIPYIDTGLQGIYSGTTEDKIQEVIGLTLDELSRLTNHALADTELQSAKELIKGNFLLSMESTDNRMSRLAKNELCFGRQIPFEETVGEIDAVDKADIQNLARELFDPEVISVTAIGPVSEKDLTIGILRG
jgi:predicted Zn-dependent peptidase